MRVPQQLVAGCGKTFLYRTIATSDKRAAKAEADAWEGLLRTEWAVQLGHATPAVLQLREVYQRTRTEAAAGAYLVHADGEDPTLLGIEHQLEQLADRTGQADLSPLEDARVKGLQDAAREVQRLPLPRRVELEPTFRELAADYVKWWKAKQGLKPSNTEQQKRATFDLFGGYWGERPLRDVRKVDAARFLDALRLMDPNWARSTSAKGLSWEQLQSQFGNRARGLTDATLNRHAATLKALWEWAAEREYCEGRNPFTGFHQRLRQGVNVSGYVAWDAEELKKLFSPPPKRSDLLEVMLVGLFTAMRLDEIASLRSGHLREEGGVFYIQVVDAKTPAGNRQVPLHDRLAWLKERAKAAGDGRIWPNFNLEGPGKKAGADAGREFSRFKTDRGFADRTKAFHSFRKNVTRIMERGRVPQNEWAQVFGHEKGFTYRVYNADGITLEQKAEIIALIDYPGVELPIIS